MGLSFILLIFLGVTMLILSGLWVFSSKREHLLSMLLRLEYIRLGVFLGLLMGLVVGDSVYALVYIIFTACEGALGLAVLVVMRRTHGGDYLKAFGLF